MHPLDNIIWQALTTRHAGLAEAFGDARTFPREVSPLTAFLEASPHGYESVAGLVRSGGVAALFLDAPYQPQPGWTVEFATGLLQMVNENGVAASTRPRGSRPEFVELDAKDSREMVELATLTRPGPFASRTHELGTFIGIRSDGKLVAMAGERLKVPGHTEISAVCTHPEHEGKGYGRALMGEVMRRIRERGETPFLHVRQENTRALELYKRLGFRERVMFHLVVLRKG